MCRPKVIRTLLAVALAWRISGILVFAQCALCKTALVNSAEGQKMASGFNTGILFLLSVPFLLVGTVAFLILSARRRQPTRSLLAEECYLA